MNKRNYLWIVQKVDYIRNSYLFVNKDVAIWIACQFALESSYGTSVIAVENNNISGMKQPLVRLSTCVGEFYGHAVYTSWMSCIYDYFLWCQYYEFTQDIFNDIKRFKTKLSKCSYCPSSDYVNSVSRVYDSYKSYSYE